MGSKTQMYSKGRWIEGCGLCPTGTGYGEVKGSCEHVNKSSGSVNCCEFFY